MSIDANIDIEVLADPPALAERVAEWLLETVSRTGGKAAVALSGGTTPKLMYETLARAPYRDAFPWQQTHWFWGDERFVLPDDKLSNYRMVREAMLSVAPVPPANVHAIPTVTLTPEASAHAYERELQDFYGSFKLDPARPLFDVVLLGLGEDGHTASLFPDTRVLEERKRWVAAVEGARSEARITLTYPVLDSAHHVAFLVTGTGKREILERFLHDDDSLPATRVRPSGTRHLFADRAAST